MLEKLKALKYILGACNKYGFSNIDSHIDSLKEVMVNVDSLMDLKTLPIEEIYSRLHICDPC